MSTHAKYGPSGYNGWSNCSAYESDSTPNVYSEAGTLAHEVAACILQGEKTPNVGIDVLRNMQDYADWVLGQCTPTTEMHVEISMDISFMTGEQGAKGTADCVLVDWDNRTISIIDLKTGHRRVNAEDNGQLQMYAAAAVALFNDMHAVINGETESGAFDTVHTIIYQSSIDHIDQHSMSVKELMGWAGAIRPAKTIRPGPKQCQWCAKKAECESYASWVHAKVNNFDPETQEANRTEKLSESFKSVDAIESWCKAVKTAAKKQLVDGGELPGFKLVQGKAGNRKWQDETAVAELMKGMRLKKDLMYKSTLITPTAATDILKSKLSRKQWETLQNHITRKEPVLQIAPDNDARPATSTVPAVFKPLGQLIE